MATDFKRGDHVEWNSEAGRVRGTIQRDARCKQTRLALLFGTQGATAVRRRRMPGWAGQIAFGGSFSSSLWSSAIFWLCPFSSPCWGGGG
jgi:hypothetical protein